MAFVLLTSTLLLTSHAATTTITLPTPITTANSTTTPLTTRAPSLSALPQTCGYKSANPNDPRVAAPGYYCATDTLYNYWGVSPPVPHPYSAHTNTVGAVVLPHEHHRRRELRRRARVQRRVALRHGLRPPGLHVDVYMVRTPRLAPRALPPMTPRRSNATRSPQSNYCVEDLLVVNTAVYRYFYCDATRTQGDTFFASADPAKSTVPRPVGAGSVTRGSSSRVLVATATTMVGGEAVGSSAVETSSASVVQSASVAATSTVVRSDGAGLAGGVVRAGVIGGLVLAVGGWV
jgi:hypothetical protein